LPEPLELLELVGFVAPLELLLDVLVPVVGPLQTPQVALQYEPVVNQLDPHSLYDFHWAQVVVPWFGGGVSVQPAVPLLLEALPELLLDALLLELLVGGLPL
jgi:hypothetical protein